MPQNEQSLLVYSQPRSLRYILEPLEQIGGSEEFLALDLYNMGFLDTHATPLTLLVSACFALFWTNTGAVDVGARNKL